MKALIFAIFISLIFSFGCLNMYSNTVNENCYNTLKYNATYEQVNCLTEKSLYLAAFGERNKALEVCKEMETNFINAHPVGIDVGNNFNIFPSYSVSMYNNCIENVAVASKDESICSQQRVPSVFSAISSVFSALPSLSSESISDAQSQGCKDNVRFKIKREEGFMNMMSRFMTLMTTQPDQAPK